MQFLSDNAASVHPKVWEAMRAADAADTPYDTDALSRGLDDAFGLLFGREVAVLAVATGTAANCIALSTLFEGYRWSALAITGSVLALLGMVVALRGRNAPLQDKP